MQKVQFEYFYNDDSEQYSFYRIPKLLFTEEYFSSLSCEAKVLYGLMLDRMSLSLKNKWFDEQNRAYIIFTIEDVMELLNCKSQKAVKIMKELDAEEGIGLIEKIRQGFGKPNIIYVKNFMIKEAEEQQQQVQENEQPKNCENQNSVIQNYQIRKIGVNLNQIAARYNSGLYLEQDRRLVLQYMEELKILFEEVQAQIWQSPN